MRLGGVDEATDRVTQDVVDEAIEVHRELGPGLLEHAYEARLAHALVRRGRIARLQVPVPLRFQGVSLDVAFRLDMLVDERVIVEVKAVEALLKVHAAQLSTYLKLVDKPVGLLIDFDEVPLKDGIRRIVRRA